tara:strand:+ start:163 stop:315 length:153 start_codon:yes stop_codon:yes gene_type:complete
MSNWLKILKSQEEASAASNLSNLQDYLKDAPRYIKTALNEIERYLGEKNV